LTSLDTPNELTLQFIEGWTIGDMADYLVAKNIIANQSDFSGLAQAGLWKQEFKFLAGLPDNETLEGYLFPDTYKFFPNSTSQDIIRKMLTNFDAKFSDEMRVVIATRGLTIHEVVKLASILEKEVKTQQDMKLVADIFNRRLAIGMLLQADSTLNYATKGKNASLTAAELAIDNPYNSYKFSGLPPTPISNPGLNALRAAVYPEVNEYGESESFISTIFPSKFPLTYKSLDVINPELSIETFCTKESELSGVVQNSILPGVSPTL
jgi:UPF0755 protein